MNENRNIKCAPSDRNQSWTSIDWNKAEETVKKLQARIVKAQKEGKYGKVKALQWTLTHSFYAKALAVKRVTSNSGSKTSGVDKILWTTPERKYRAIATLKRRGYKPQPLKRVNIKKSNGKLRPLGIPTMTDRAMQALYLMALDPVAETISDKYSFGFRKNRCCADAMIRCHTLLSRSYSPEWVLEGDIKGCFDHISHDWLLNNVPMDKEILRKWLKCGFVFKGEVFPTEEGTPQGGIISPTLANIALNGIEKALSGFKQTTRNGAAYNPKVSLVRYADDFIITGASKEILENKVKPILVEFFQERGLELSEEKTVITHVSEGFDFLGFNVRKYNGTLLTKPSKKSVKKLTEKVKVLLKSHRAVKQEEILMMLNPILTGWSMYYRYCAASETFRKTDQKIFNMIWRWCLRRHSNKSLGWIKNRYFHRVNNRDWCFGIAKDSPKGNTHILLARLFDTKITKYPQIKGDANPYDAEWYDYFLDRNLIRMKESLKGRKSLIFMWERQNQCCPLCGEPITKDTPWRTVMLNVDGISKLHLAHETCCKSLNKKGGLS